MKPLTRFGTYGFLCALMATQLSAMPLAFGDTHQDKADRARLDMKKSARSVKRDMKKTGRKVTGQDNSWDDLKDEVGDAGRNVKDDANYHAKKIERKAR